MKIAYFALFFAVYVMIPSSGSWNDFYLLTHTSRDTQLSRKLSMIDVICANEIIAPDVVVQKLTHILLSTAIDRNFSITLRTAITVVSHYFLLLTRDVSWSEVITTNKAQRRGIGIRRTQLLNAINRNFVTIPRMKCPYAVSRYSFSLLAQTRNLKCNQQDARRKARKVSVQISLRIQVYKQVKIKKNMIKTPIQCCRKKRVTYLHCDRYVVSIWEQHGIRAHVIKLRCIVEGICGLCILRDRSVASLSKTCI